MIDRTPSLTMTDADLEAWFSAAGVSATVTDRCPDTTCPVCGSPVSVRAA